MQNPLISTPIGPNWRLLSGLVLLGLALAALLTFRDYGISWDEPVQNTYGVDLLDFYTSDFRDREALAYMNLFFYGGFFDIVAAVLNKVSPFGVYETRHLWGAVLSLVGIVGAYRLASLLAGARAGFFAVVLLGLQSLMYGHDFINPKDAPLGWIMLWVIYFAARVLIEPSPRTASIVGFAIAGGLALGTRIMAAPVFGYVIGALIVGALAHRWRQTNPSVARAAFAFAAAIPLIYAVMALCWPWSIQKPLNPIVALHEFTNFPWSGQILWNGQMVPSAHLPRTYLLLLFWYQLPEHMLIGLAMAAGSGLALFARRRFDLLADRRCLPVLLLMAAGIVPLVGFSILTPTIYNGLRHFLFIIPALGVLAALGWDAGLDLIARRGAKLVPAALVALAGLCLLQIREMVRLHPYEYVAYNSLLGDLPHARGRFELDYWDVSFKEAAQKLGAHLAKTGDLAPVVFVCGNQLSAQAYLPDSVRYTYRIEEADYLVSDVPSPCGYLLADMTSNRVVEVEREGVVLSYVIDLKARRGGPSRKPE